MKTDANWCVRIWTLVLVLTMAFAALSCGNGGGGSVNLTPGGGGNGVSSDPTNANSPQLITEEEISSLPAWQQEMLSDPGWNQPYIPPRPETAMPAPSYDMLIAETQKAMEQGINIQPRSTNSGKSASWDDQKNYTPPTNVAQGEYETLAPNGDPGFGCNTDGSNANSGHAIEDVIDAGSMSIPQRISYVENGWSTANYFNETGGTGNDARSAVYQLFSSDRSADPTDPSSTADFGELSYRADLAPGIAPGGDCGTAEAFAVSGWFWKVFNSEFTALPQGSSTQLFNILIAPSSTVSATKTSSGDTVARYQEFYFGSISNCYGGAWIVGLESSASDCTDFADYVTAAQTTGFFVRPIYGVLLKRWQDYQVGSMAGPWETNYGWPVFGPVAYNNGTSVLNSNGTYYAWGMWFEKGFMWWIDYDQDAYPGTPDECQAFTYTGSNVYCKTANAEYLKQDTMYYGGEGDLGVSVVMTGFRSDLGDPWSPARLNTSDPRPGTYYEIPLGSDDGLAQVQVALHASGYGGETDADCLYKYYVWAFRDGTIQAAGAAYDPDQASTTHIYGDTLRNLESVYVVRVQITDATFDNGNDSTEHRAFGDSLPIHLGHGGGGGGGEIWLIRNDGGSYDTNYDALKADLDEIGAAYGEFDYSDTVADDFHAAGAKVAVWYRGGPGGGGESSPQNKTWTTNEINNLRQICSDSHRVLLVSQGNSVRSYFVANYGYTNAGWTNTFGFTTHPEILTGYSDPNVQNFHWTWGASNQNGFDLGLMGRWLWSVPTDWTGTLSTSQNPLNFLAPLSSGAAERYSGSGSSGTIPITMDCGTSPVQASGFGFIDGYTGAYSSNTLTCGMGIDHSSGSGPASYPWAFVSWGNTAAPNTADEFSYPYDGSPGGAGKIWVVAAPYSQLEVSSSTAGGAGSMTRAQVLQNELAWLDSTLTFGGGGGGGGGSFSEYEGPAEIVMVKAISWFGGGGITEGAPSYTGTNYPDTTGTDVFKDYVAVNPPGTDFVRDGSSNTLVENGLNVNDIDMQFPWYGYIYDADGSLTSGGPAVSGDEVFIMRGGLLVDNPTGVWTRVNPGMAGYVDWFTNNLGADPGSAPPSDFDTDDDSDWQDVAGWDFDVPWAGYYVTSTDIVTNPGLDTAVRATYGTDPSSLIFLSVDEPLSFETIAHWPPTQTWGGDPAAVQLGWACYPGHTMALPGTSQYFGQQLNWTQFVTRHDISPSSPLPPANRDHRLWLFQDFGFSQGVVEHGSRVVTFDFASVDGWNGDLDMDSNTGEDPDDKFPVRVRLLSDTTNFPRPASGWVGTFPNQFPDPTPILEGGCYVVDNSAAGAGGPPILTAEETPTDIAAGYNIRWTGTYPGSPSWDVDVTYTIDPGCNFPMAIDYDFDGDIVDPTNFDADVNGLGRMAPGTFTETVSVTPGDINGYAWTNGDLNFLVVRGTNAQGVGFAAFNIPLWLGDIIYFENFEGDQHAIPTFVTTPIWVDQATWDVANASNWITYDGTGAYGTPGNPHVAAVTSRAWLNEVPNMGTNCMFWDNGNAGSPAYYEYPYRTPVVPPKMSVTNTDTPYQYFRMAGIMGVDRWGFARMCTYPGYSYPVSFNVAGQYYVSGTTPNTSIIRHDPTYDFPYGTSWLLPGNKIRIGVHAYTWFQGAQVGPPGGGVVDNMLWTHSTTTYPPYL